MYLKHIHRNQHYQKRHFDVYKKPLHRTITPRIIPDTTSEISDKSDTSPNAVRMSSTQEFSDSASQAAIAPSEAEQVPCASGECEAEPAAPCEAAPVECAP